MLSEKKSKNKINNNIRNKLMKYTINFQIKNFNNVWLNSKCTNYPQDDAPINFKSHWQPVILCTETYVLIYGHSVRPRNNIIVVK